MRTILLLLCSIFSVSLADFNFDIYNLQQKQSNFVFFGTAQVAVGGRLGTGQQYNVITLTQAANDQAGAAWLATPQDVTQGFKVDLFFAISNEERYNTADGMAFIINANPTLTAATGLGGGSSAYSGLVNTVALEIDTYSNTETNDPNGNTIHTGLQSCGPSTANDAIHGGSCSLASAVPINSFFESYDGSIHHMEIVYDNTAKTFTVSLDGSQLYSVSLDLTTKLNLINGSKAYLGFTASTGGAHGRFDWAGMNYVSNYSPAPTLASPAAQPDVSFGSNNLQQSNFNFFGSTRVGSVSGTPSISLVQGLNNQRGSAWYNAPVDVTDFRVDLDFAITKRPQDPINNVADGMTFIINANPSLTESTGYEGAVNTIAVEIDTYVNMDKHDPLRVPHTGLQGCGPSTPTNGDHTGPCALNPGVPLNIPSYDGSIHTLSCVYDGDAKYFATYLDGSLVYNASVDLTTKLDLINGKQAFLGFFSATGGATGSFDWLAMRYYKNVKPIVISTVVNPGCATGTYTSSFTVSVSGGVGPYTYSINNSSRSVYNQFDVNTAANYTITVYDNAGNSASSIVFVGPSTLFSAYTVSFIPYGSLAGFRTSSVESMDGVVTAYAQGGVAPYRYTLIPASKRFGYRVNPTSANATFANLAAGSYTLIATDANNCQSRAIGVTVQVPTLPSAPTISISNVAVINQDPSVYVSASWTAPTFNGYSDIVGYIVQFGTFNGSATIWGSNISVTSPSVYAQIPITNSTKGYIRVAAVNSVGAGAFSSVIQYVTLCNAGFYPLGSVCSPCASGTSTKGLIGRAFCRACSIGQYAAAGSPSCSNCAGNTYSAANAATCSNCSVGYVASSDNSYCQPCPAGYYQATPSSTQCTLCPANTYSKNIAQTSCTACASGTYSNPGSSSCVDPSGYKK